MEHTEFTPDWRDIDPIFDWVAIDEDGCIYKYKSKPVPLPHTVLGGLWAYDNDGNEDSALIGTTTPPTDFTKCLYQRPKTETEHEQ